MRHVYLASLVLLAPVAAGAQPVQPPAISQLQANPSGGRAALGLGTAATYNTGVSGATVPLLNGANNVWGGNQYYYGGSTAFGNGSGAQTINLNGGTGQNRNIQWQSGSSLRWGLSAQLAETGNNSGGILGLFAYTDSGAYSGQVLGAVRGSGPYGTGAPYLSNLAPYTQITPHATTPGGVFGNDSEFGNASDAQPISALGANPLTTVSGSATVTVNWPNCCGAGGAVSTGSQTWIDLLGASAVGGITPTGWLQVKSIVDANDFTVTWTSSANAAATGGGASVTVQPSFDTAGTKFVATSTSGAAGFVVGHTDLWDANPSFYQSQNVSPVPQYQHKWQMTVSPPDTSQTHAFGTVGEEHDFINRASDEGYFPNLYGTPRPTIGLWYGPQGGPVPSTFPGGGTAKNWNTIYACFSDAGVVGIYDCGSVQPNALVGAANDPSGHGGVGYDIFGAWTQLGSNPFSTSLGSNVIAVAGVTNGPLVQANGNTVWIPSVYTINGVTFGGGSYAIANLNTSTGAFTITGTGSATAAGSGGGSNQAIYFSNLVPYAPAQFWGEFKHGVIAAPNAKFDVDEINLPGFLTSPTGATTIGTAASSGPQLILTTSAGSCTHTPGSSTETVTCSSDRKFKSDIHAAWWHDFASGWLWDMPVSDYVWKATGEHVVGVVAQDLQKTHPEMVHQETAPDGSHYLAVDEPNIWRLLLAIQELQALAALACVVALLSWLWHLRHWHRHHRGHASARR